jgi:hypothetical protein
MEGLCRRHTSVGVELGVVDVVDNIFDRLDIAVPSVLLAPSWCLYMYSQLELLLTS